MLHTRFCAVKTNDARFCKERQKETPYRLIRYGVLWTRRESNPRPFGCEPNALPTELRAHKKAPNFEWGQMSYNTRSGIQRLLSQLSYEPIFKPPKTAWGRVVYNSRLFKDRMGSQLSYRPMMMTLIVYRVLGRLSSNFGEREQGTYKRPSCQKATALAAATLRESTPWDIGIFTV